MMNSMLQKMFKVIEYGNFREEPFVFTRTKCPPPAWSGDRPGALGSSTRCVVDELMAARTEARSISFPLSEFSCLTGRLLNDHNEKIKGDEYLTFKPFAMVTAHENPELFVLFCRGEDLRDIFMTLEKVEGKVEISDVPLSSVNCRLLTRPLVNLTGGRDKILLYPLRPGPASLPDSEMMAVLPMPLVVRMADIIRAD